MRLKIKLIKWSAGFPVVMLSKRTAEKLGVHSRDRVFIKTISHHPRKISTIVDTVEGLVGEKEILVSSELKKHLDLKVGQFVNVDLSPTSKSLVYIRKKLNNKRLSKKEIEEIITDIVNNSISEAEIALFVSAMYEKGMNMEETIYLIKAILKSGSQFKLKGEFIVDKHCVGGVPGNRTTPIVVPICACADLFVPKTSSRAITTAAGTADVIETLAPVDFSIKQIKKIVSKTKACMVWGGALGIVPADSKILQIEKILGVDPEAQLLASIMSKKLSVGSKYILIDIPYGDTAKVSKRRALRLKKKFEYLGRYFRKRLKVVLTDGSQPIGNGIGPALELMDIIKILDPKKQGPKDLEKKSLFLAGEILEMTKKAKKGKGAKMAEEILYSGKAFEKFKEIIKAQGGDGKKLRFGKFSRDILSTRSGKIHFIDNRKINTLARVTGCPVNKYAGVYLYHHLGDKVKKRGKILTLYSDSESKLEEAIKFYYEFKPIKIKS